MMPIGVYVTGEKGTYFLSALGASHQKRVVVGHPYYYSKLLLPIAGRLEWGTLENPRVP